RRAVAAAGKGQRERAMAVGNAEMQGCVRAHRQPDDMGTLDAKAVQHAADVVARARLRIALDVLWDLRRRIAAGVIGNAAIASRNPPAGGKLVSKAIDLSLPGAAEELARWAGDLDILVNNAGAIPGGDLLKVDEDTWRRAWDLKVFGYINLTRAVYGAMKEK